MSVIDEIAAERRRQVDQEGWSPEHDDRHENGSIVLAAVAYAMASITDQAERAVMDEFGDWESTPYDILKFWPWDREWWKPKSRRRDLIRAAALIAAEIERLDRAGAAK